MERTKNIGGFSLLELVVYIGIVTAVAGVFTSVFESTVKTQLSEKSQNEVTSQLNFSVQTVQRLIKSSSVIQFDECGATTTLSLLMPENAKSPTTIYTQNGKLYVKQGTNPAEAITSDSVTVDSLQFQKFCNTASKDTIKIDIAISKPEPGTDGRISRSLSSAVSRVNAVTFDSSLLPPVDATYDVGTWPTLRWRNGAFSGQLKATELCIGDTCQTSWPSGSTGTLTGTGTNYYLPMWTSATSLGDSPIYKSGNIIFSSLPMTVSGALTVNIPEDPNGFTVYNGPVGNNQIRVNGENNTLILQESSGFVGIGTANPQSTLDVSGNIKASGNGLFGNSVGIGTTTPQAPLVVVSGAGTATVGEIRFGGAAGSRTLSAYYNGALANFDFLANQTAFNSDFLIASGKKISTFNASNGNLYLTADGSGIVYTDKNFGIGTTNPSNPLTIEGPMSSTDTATSIPLLAVKNINTLSTGLVSTVINLARTTADNAGDGFGPQVLFAIEDNLQGEQENIAGIGAVRNGDNLSGDLIFRTFDTGVSNERMRITKNGNVGIGISNPTSALQVNTATTYSYAHLTDSTTGSAITDGILLGVSGDTGLVWLKEASSLKFATSDVQRMTILADGKVGIGNTNPGRLLHVGSGTDTGQSYTTLIATNNGNTAITVRDSTYNTEMEVSVWGQQGYIGTETNHKMNFMVNDVVYTTLDTSGNFGIGITSPAAKLHVNATSSIPVGITYTPPSSTTACTTGMVSWDSGYIYLCVSTNVWRRAYISSF